jgi:hypothetical protein
MKEYRGKGKPAESKNKKQETFSMGDLLSKFNN